MAHQCGDLTFVDISINVRLEWCNLSVAHILATVCLTEALVLQHKPLTCDNNGGARKESGFMVAARVITSQKQLLNSRLHVNYLGSHALQRRGHIKLILIAGVKNVGQCTHLISCKQKAQFFVA